MPDLLDGQTMEWKGSGSRPYLLKNVGGVYSCTCPAWRNQSVGIERRTCKHLRKLRGDAAEEARIGGALPQRPARTGGEGEESAGPPLLLAESWDNSMDLSGWWMSEKLDGVRAYWDGTQFLSRLGNLFHAPDWFLEGLPDTPLDGELWIDRKKFQRTVSIVRRQDKCDLWCEVRFLVFDAPALEAPFEDRVAYLHDTFATRSPRFAIPHPHQVCTDLDCLRSELERVEALGGEGLMLREPGSRYHAGRSTTLLKVKRFQDAEAVVIAHQAGAGRHKGRLGALQVRLQDGTEFAVGTGFSDRERENPPEVGSTITFRYQELSEAGVPRFPSYVGLRAEIHPAAVPPTPGASSDPNQSPAVMITVPERPAQPGAPPDGPVIPGKPRYFEFVGGTSSKFWEVSHSGCELKTRWGRIGTAGQSKTKSFVDESAAAQQAQRLISEKSSEGYVEKSVATEN